MANANKSKPIWHCISCGCYTWKVSADGTMICANCDRVTDMDPAQWKRLPKAPKNAPYSIGSIHSMNVSYGLLKRHFLNNFQETDDMAIIIKKDGSVKTYGVCEARQHNWLVDRLENAFKLLTGK